MSEAATIRAKGKGDAASKTRATYMRRLAAEIVSGEPHETYSNSFLERGKAQEDEARRLYAFACDTRPEQVGFIKNGPQGASPDGLIGADGMVEIKTRMGHLQVELLLSDKFPPEHVAQTQGNLWIAEREWIDLVVYSPGLPLWVKRAYRDAAYIAELAAAVDQFNDELAAMVEKVRRYGEAPAPLATQLKRSLEAVS